MSTINSAKLLLTAREAAAAMSISLRTLWTLTASQQVPHIRVGRSVRYPTDALQQWIEAKQKGGEPK
jgi:excisionase family DNA binding protein